MCKISILLISEVVLMIYLQNTKYVPSYNRLNFEKVQWKGYFFSHKGGRGSKSEYHASSLYIIGNYNDKLLVFVPTNFAGYGGASIYEQLEGDIYVFYLSKNKLEHLFSSADTYIRIPEVEYDNNMYYLKYFSRYISGCMRMYKWWNKCLEEEPKRLKEIKRVDTSKEIKIITKYKFCDYGSSMLYTGEEKENVSRLDVGRCYVKKYNDDKEKEFPIFRVFDNEVSDKKIVYDRNFTNFVVYPSKDDFVIPKNHVILYNRKENKLILLKIPVNANVVSFLSKNKLLLSRIVNGKVNERSKIYLFSYDIGSQKHELLRVFQFNGQIKSAVYSYDTKFLNVVEQIKCNKIKELKQFSRTMRKRIRLFCLFSFYSHKQYETLWLISTHTKRRIAITNSLHFLRFKKGDRSIETNCYKLYYNGSKKGRYYYWACEEAYQRIGRQIIRAHFLPSYIEDIKWDYKSRKILFSIRPALTPAVKQWFYFYISSDIEGFMHSKRAAKKSLNKKTLQFSKKIFRIYMAQYYDLEEEKFYFPFNHLPIQSEIVGFYRNNKIILKLYPELCNKRKEAESSVVLWADRRLKDFGLVTSSLCDTYNDNPKNFYLFTIPIKNLLQKLNY